MSALIVYFLFLRQMNTTIKLTPIVTAAKTTIRHTTMTTTLMSVCILAFTVSENKILQRVQLSSTVRSVTYFQVECIEFC